MNVTLDSKNNVIACSKETKKSDMETDKMTNKQKLLNMCIGDVVGHAVVVGEPRSGKTLLLNCMTFDPCSHKRYEFHTWGEPFPPCPTEGVYYIDHGPVMKGSAKGIIYNTIDSNVFFVADMGTSVPTKMVNVSDMTNGLSSSTFVESRTLYKGDSIKGSPVMEASTVLQTEVERFPISTGANIDDLLKSVVLKITVIKAKDIKEGTSIYLVFEKGRLNINETKNMLEK